MTNHNADELAGRLERIAYSLCVLPGVDCRNSAAAAMREAAYALRHPQQPQGGVASELRAALLNSPCPHPVANAGDDRSVRKCVGIGACGCENKSALAALPSPVAEEGDDELVVEAQGKLIAIFANAPWLIKDGKAVHLPIAGMDKDHQVTWPELHALFRATLQAAPVSPVAEDEKQVTWLKSSLVTILTLCNSERPPTYASLAEIARHALEKQFAASVSPVAQSELSDRELEQVEYARQQEKETAGALVPLVHVANITRLLAIIDRLSGDSKNG